MYKLSRNKNIKQDWTLLCDLVSHARCKDPMNDLDTFKRHFLAHSGFEFNVTLIRKNSNIPEVKYKDEYKNLIGALILEL